MCNLREILRYLYNRNHECTVLTEMVQGTISDKYPWFMTEIVPSADLVPLFCYIVESSLLA